MLLNTQPWLLTASCPLTQDYAYFNGVEKRFAMRLRALKTASAAAALTAAAAAAAAATTGGEHLDVTA